MYSAFRSAPCPARLGVRMAMRCLEERHEVLDMFGIFHSPDAGIIPFRDETANVLETMIIIHHITPAERNR